MSACSSVCAHRELLTGLHALASSGDEASPYLCFRVTRSNAFRAVEFNNVFLALPLWGEKRISLSPVEDKRVRGQPGDCLERNGGRGFSVNPGEILLATGPCRADVENVPDPGCGEYLAIGIPIPESLLEIARRLLPERVRGSAGELVTLGLESVSAPLAAWTEALRAGNAARANHAMLGLILALNELGHHGVLEEPAPRLSDRIWRMVSELPAHDWSSEEVEKRFAMSGASLRRHLAAEGTSLRKIIAEARLALALVLLQTTRLPVKTVAQRVGYASVSSFVKRFSERYGVEPSRIGSV